MGHPAGSQKLCQKNIQFLALKGLPKAPKIIPKLSQKAIKNVSERGLRKKSTKSIKKNDRKITASNPQNHSKYIMFFCVFTELNLSGNSVKNVPKKLSKRAFGALKSNQKASQTVSLKYLKKALKMMPFGLHVGLHFGSFWAPFYIFCFFCNRFFSFIDPILEIFLAPF